jgi:hypothetical protein
MWYVRGFLCLLIVFVATLVPLAAADPSTVRDDVAYARELIVVRDKKERDDRRKAVGNAEKQGSQDGNPPNRDKVDRQRLREILDGEKERRVETNNLPNEALQIEGQVLETLCKRNPKEVIIGTIGGNVTLRLIPRRLDDGFLYEGEVRCDDLVPGDYVYVHEGMRETEHLFDVYQLRCRRDRSVTDVVLSGNGNEDDEDDRTNAGENSCPHIRSAAQSRLGGVESDVAFRWAAADGAMRQAGDNGNDNEDLRRVDEGSEPNPLADFTTLIVAAGEAGTLTSPDGTVAISVRPGSMTRPLVLLYRDVEPLALPAMPPSNLNVGAVFFLLAGTDEGPLTDALPGPVNLSIRMRQEYARDVDPSRATIAILETDQGGWVPIESTADTDSGYVSATISRVGLYSAYAPSRR